MIAAGLGFTVATAERVQPFVPVAMMVVVPAVSPDKVPEDAPIVPTAVLPLLHVAPAEDVSVVLAPTQTLSAPPIAAGAGRTVTTLVTRQPDDGNV